MRVAPSSTIAEQLDALYSRRSADVVVVDQLEDSSGGFPPTRCMRWVRSSPRRPRPGSWWRPCGPTSWTNATVRPSLAPLLAEGVHLVGAMRDRTFAPRSKSRRGGRLLVEAGLSELILRDAAGHSTALPLLSHALVETWLRREASVLTVAGYEEVGD